MAESWVRLWSGMTTDPKWQTIARKSGQPRYLVIALFTHLMLEANEADDRGSLGTVDVEDVASALDCDEEAVEAILQAMEGRVIEDGRLSGWDRRQPVREDQGNSQTGALSSTERSRLHREKKRVGNAPQRDATQCNAPQRDATQCNAPQRDATQCNAPEAEAEAEAEKPLSDRERSKAERGVAPALASAGLAPPTEAGAACLQMRAAGTQGVNPSHPKLLGLLAAGVTPDEIGEVAREPKARGKGMAWVLATVEGRRRDAATDGLQSRGQPMHPPGASPGGSRPASPTLSEQRAMAARTITNAANPRQTTAPFGARDDRIIDVTPPTAPAVG